MGIPRSGRCMRGFGMYRLLVVAGIALFNTALSYAATTGPNEQSSSEGTGALPYEITPEGVKSLAEAHVPFRLIDAGRPAAQQPAPGQVRAIYYTTLPSFRGARNQVVRDRNAGLKSQRLVGTPEDWRRLNLDIDPSAMPAKVASLSARELSDAIKDEADMDLVDLRAKAPSAPNATSPFPQALRLMPHEIEGALSMLSKRRWIVLIDGGNREAVPTADWLIRRGYPLVAVLDGGYPAWIRFTDR